MSLDISPSGGSQPTGCRLPEKLLGETEQIGWAIDVRQWRENRRNEAVTAETPQHVAEGEATAPAHAAEQSPGEAPQADQIETAVGARAEDGVTGAKLIKSLAQHPRRQQRGVGSDNHCKGMVQEEPPECALEPHAKVFPLLWRELPFARQAQRGKGSAGAEQPTSGDF